MTSQLHPILIVLTTVLIGCLCFPPKSTHDKNGKAELNNEDICSALCEDMACFYDCLRYKSGLFGKRNNVNWNFSPRQPRLAVNRFDDRLFMKLMGRNMDETN